MIALDTNVLVRFLVRDDEKQARAAYARFKKAEAARERLFIPVLVMLETIWVLESAYDKSRQEILDAFVDLKQMPIFRFEQEEAIQRLLDEGRKNGIDLADLLILLSAQEAGCERCLTFDKKAARHSGFQLLA